MDPHGAGTMTWPASQPNEGELDDRPRLDPLRLVRAGGAVHGVRRVGQLRAKEPRRDGDEVGWFFITLYMGPVGLALYVLTDKEPSPGTHEEFIRPLWKQGVGSTVHCIAGDATGIIAAAAITALLGLPMRIDFVVEYAAGFAFGLLIFQSLFMKDMLGGSYGGAVRQTFVPEWLSMNMMAAGMFPTMALLMMGRDMRAMEPTEPLFWAVMSLGVIIER
jgi:hypothetical protein